MVAAATVDGSATVRIGEHEIEIHSSNFLDNGVLLARYAGAIDDLDTVLDAAGVLPYFADYLDQATAVPDDRTGPAKRQPALPNRRLSPPVNRCSAAASPSTAFSTLGLVGLQAAVEHSLSDRLRNTSSVPPAID